MLITRDKQKAVLGMLRLYLWLIPMVAFTWLSSMFLHEIGHILSGWLSGGEFRYIDVYPFHFSTTILQPNPYPALVTWSGLLLGWSLPLLTIPLWKIEWAALGPSVQGWSAYCWLAFGAYLALAAGESLSDTGQLLTEGWPLAVLVAVGAAVAICGYFIGRIGVTRLHRRFSATPPSWRSVGAALALFMTWYALQYSVANWMNIF
ncbi:MAG: hypothetical protein SFV81_06135 [Pirellulaceae bacterium]|nr:hypothetical protein [Pirellulaceae bacterium]